MFETDETNALQTPGTMIAFSSQTAAPQLMSAPNNQTDIRIVTSSDSTMINEAFKARGQ